MQHEWSESEIQADNSARVRWYATAAIAIAGAVALFLYADGYFEANGSDRSADAPHIIEGL